MADYNSDRTGSNIDLTLDKVDALDAKVQPTATGANVTGTVTADGLTVESNNNSVGAVTTLSNTNTSTDGNTVIGNLVFESNDDSAGATNAELKGISAGTGGQTELYIRTGSSGVLNNRVKFGFDGDVSFYEDTGTTAKMVWDASAEGLSIGGTALGKFNVSDGTNPLSIDSSTYNEIQSYNRPLLLNRQGNNVGIGTASPSAKLSVDGNIWQGNTAGVQIGGITNAAGWYDFGGTSNVNGAQISGVNIVRFRTGATERMRIDSSGNLLVGKTSLNSAVAGIELRTDGRLGATYSGGNPAFFNRLSSDGEIVRLLKDGTTVGSIGSIVGQYLSIGTGDTGIAFDDDANHIIPWNTTTNGATDSSVDLGTGGARFKDLYLSGGVYLGGTGAVNKLDDYEEGSWTPDFRFSGGSAGVTGTQVGKFTKIGNKVTAYFEIRLTSKGTSIGQARIYGLPFVAASSPVDWVGSVCVNFANLSGLNSLPTAFVTDGTSYLNLYQLNSAGSGDAYLSNSNVGDGLILGATVTYFTNS